MTDAAWPRIEGDPGLAAVYEALLVEVGRLGPYEVRYRKSAVQLLRPDGAGVLAVHPDQDGLAVTLVVDQPSSSPRVLSSHQVSPGLWNQRCRLTGVADLEEEFRDRLAVAYHRA